MKDFKIILTNLDPATSDDVIEGASELFRPQEVSNDATKMNLMMNRH